MSNTLGDILDRMADETRYSGSDERTIFKLCVQDAIAHYEVEEFWWNQSRTVTFNTVAAQEYYSSSDNASIPYILDFDAVTITRSSTDKYTLYKTEWDLIEYKNADAQSTSIPSEYAYWNQQIRFYPVPDAAYAVRIAGLFKLTALSADADTNAWVTLGEGEELIRNHAEGLFYSKYVRDDDNATRAINLAQVAYQRLRESTNRRVRTGEIRGYL
jgi:hypothetical protein